MDLLILGGTAWLGRAVAQCALHEGVSVTCLARGSAPTVTGAVFVAADRDGPEALGAVRGHRWDAVIDLTMQPGQAARAARDLTADHRVFVSTCSVYAEHDTPEPTEGAATVAPLDADAMTSMEDYGPAKVACEDAYRQVGGSGTIIRPGLIGGYGDHTGRSGYYPWRFAHPTGDDVLFPDPTFPTALIDVDDLAAWIVHCATRQVNGVFNAAGETTALAEVFRSARAVAGADAVPRAVSDADLLRCGVTPWMGPRSLPLWIPGPALRYAATADSASARAEGLATRPVRDTLVAALRFENERGGPSSAGLSDEEERRLRAMLEA